MNNQDNLGDELYKENKSRLADKWLDLRWPPDRVEESASEEMALEMSSKGRERDKYAMICRIIQVESTAWTKDILIASYFWFEHSLLKSDHLIYFCLGKCFRLCLWRPFVHSFIHPCTQLFIKHFLVANTRNK